MPEWATFVGFTLVVTSGLLVLSHLSSGVLTDSGSVGEQAPDEDDDSDETGGTQEVNGDQNTAADSTDSFRGGRTVRDDSPHRTFDDGSTGPNKFDRPTSSPEAVDAHADDADRVVLPKSGIEYRPQKSESANTDAQPIENMSTTSLLANVALSQGLFGVLLLAGAWYAEIPASAFGVIPESTGLRAVAIGIGLGVVLYVANEMGAALGSRAGLGLGDGERLRSALAPETLAGWATLLLVVLPVIAGFEELLFRGALVGVVATGYDVSPWVMAIVASGAFALGHGAQGRLGIIVTGALGFVLAAAFVVTGSLLVVVVAHYLVNALEFVVHEGIGVEWPPDRG